jgi:hypothetical protein
MKGYGQFIGLEKLYHSSCQSADSWVPWMEQFSCWHFLLLRHMTLSIAQQIIGSQYSGQPERIRR